MDFGRLFNRSAKQSEVLGIEFADAQFFAVLMNKQGVVNAYRPDIDSSNLDAAGQWVRDNKLQKSNVCTCLNHADYRLMMVEAPAVPDDEISDALAFSVRDLLDDFDQWIIQGFKLPEKAFHGRKPMAMAVAARRDAVKNIVDWCEVANVNLKNITIPELALSHVLKTLDPNGAIGVLRLSNKEGEIYFYEDGALYLTRDIHIGTDDVAGSADNISALSLESDSRSEALVLEVQRSMNYFESQMGMSPLSQLWILPPDNGADVMDLGANIENLLGLPVRCLSLDHLFEKAQEKSDTPATCASILVALGGALAYDMGN